VLDFAMFGYRMGGVRGRSGTIRDGYTGDATSAIGSG